MKKIYTFVGALAFLCSGAFAQNQVVQHTVSNLVKMKKAPLHLNKSVADTLGFDEFFSSSNTYGYGQITGYKGFFSGTNWDSTGAPGNEYGDFTGYFNLGDNYNVTDVVGYCGMKSYVSGGGTSNLTAMVYLIDDSTSYSGGSVSYSGPAPGTQVGGSGSITVSSIDTSSSGAGGLFDIPLSTPAIITPSSGDWGVYVDFTDCYTNSDSIGLGLNSPTGLTYTQDDYDMVHYNTGSGYLWVRTADYLTNAYTSAIFAVVHDNTGIEHYDGHGLKMYVQGANPSNGNTTICYRLKNSGEAHFRMLDASGKVVYQESGAKQAGITNKVHFNKGQLASGIYFYQLNANGETLTMKLVVE